MVEGANEVLNSVLLFSTVIAFIVVALVNVVKGAFPVPKNFVPIVGIVIGMIIGALAQPFTELDLPLRLWAGAIAGLSATGLFETFNKRDGTTK